MGSRPKMQDYKPSEAEKTEARIAAQKREFFNEHYAPLNVAELKDSMTDDIKNLARARGNADVMQGLTSNLTYAQTQNAGDVVADLSGAYQGVLGSAGSGALDIQNKRGTAAIGSAQGQSATTAGALSTLTNIGNNRVLDAAKNKAMVRAARDSAIMKVAGAGADKMFGAKEGQDPTAWDKFRDAYKEYS